MHDQRLIAYLDNDVALKLARLDLIDEALASIGADRSSTRLLPGLLFYFGLHPKTAARRRPKFDFDDAVAERLCQVVEESQRGWNPPIAKARTLSNVPEIDSGEELLIESAAATPDALLVTGDKRALWALATFEGGAMLRRRLAGRVICFEEIMLRLLDKVPFPRLCDLVRGAGGSEVDGVLGLAFRGASPRPQDARDALTSYWSSLERDTGALLVHRAG